MCQRRKVRQTTINQKGTTRTLLAPFWHPTVVTVSIRVSRWPHPSVSGCQMKVQVANKHPTRKTHHQYTMMDGGIYKGRLIPAQERSRRLQGWMELVPPFPIISATNAPPPSRVVKTCSVKQTFQTSPPQYLNTIDPHPHAPRRVTCVSMPATTRKKKNKKKRTKKGWARRAQPHMQYVVIMAPGSVALVVKAQRTNTAGSRSPRRWEEQTEGAQKSGGVPVFFLSSQITHACMKEEKCSNNYVVRFLYCAIDRNACFLAYHATHTGKKEGESVVFPRPRAPVDGLGRKKTPLLPAIYLPPST